MKVSRYNLNILVSEVQSLVDEYIPELHGYIDKWTNIQEDRDMYGSTDQEWAATQRYYLEQELTKFREKLAVIYDFMGDRGLTEFIPTRVRNEMAEEEARRKEEQRFQEKLRPIKESYEQTIAALKAQSEQLAADHVLLTEEYRKLEKELEEAKEVIAVPEPEPVSNGPTSNLSPSDIEAIAQKLHEMGLK